MLCIFKKKKKITKSYAFMSGPLIRQTYGSYPTNN